MITRIVEVARQCLGALSCYKMFSSDFSYVNREDTIRQQLQAAVQAYLRSDLDGAEFLAKKILALTPQNSNALHLLSCIYRDHGQLPQSVELILLSIREDPSNPNFFLSLGKILALAGQHLNAASVLQESLKRSEHIAETWFCFGNALMEIEKVHEANQAYRTALRLNPAHVGAASNFGALLTDAGHMDEAEEVFSQAFEHVPKDVNLIIDFCRLLAHKEDYCGAIMHYQTAISFVSLFSELHFNQANLLMQGGKVEEAIAAYCKAIEIKADFPEAYLNLGSGLKQIGQYEKAISSYQKAIELKSGFVAAYAHLGQLLIEHGDAVQAMTLLNNAYHNDASLLSSLDFVAQISSMGDDFVECIFYGCLDRS